MAGSACRQRFYEHSVGVEQSLDASASTGGACVRDRWNPIELAETADLLDWQLKEFCPDVRRSRSGKSIRANQQRGRFHMKSRSLAVAFVALFGLALPVLAENAKPVRMGCGIMTF